MKVHSTLILGLVAFAVIAYVVLMPVPMAPAGTAGPRQPRGGDVWQNRPDLVR